MAGPMANSFTASSDLPSVVFVNATAGGGRAKGLLPRMKRLFQELDAPAEFTLTNNVVDLETRARKGVEEGRELFLAMGGDGTFQALANAIGEKDVVLGILPVGSGNDFAAALGLPSDPFAAARALLQGEPRRVDMLRVRTADGQERLYAGGGGVGLDAEAAQFASGALRHLPGRIRYISAALRALHSFHGVGVRVEFPGSEVHTIEAKALLAGVLNTPTYGGGVRLAPDARLDDGILDVVIVEDLGLLEILTLLPRLLWSGELRTKKLIRARAQRARLITDRPSIFHGDGEALGPAPVEIEVAAGAIQVLAPAGVNSRS
jgi:diacylglycerol kinase (ATP)